MVFINASFVNNRDLLSQISFVIILIDYNQDANILYQFSVTEPHRRGLHRRAPCSRVHLAYSLYQLHAGISPPYALDPYDRSHNVLQTLRIYTLCSHCPYPMTLYCAFLLLTLSLQLILYFCNIVGTVRNSVPISYLTLYF